MRWMLFFLLLSEVPVSAETVLQKQADHAQNYLELTFSKISSSWSMMKYHFAEGNKKLKETAKEKAPEIPEKLKFGN